LVGEPERKTQRGRPRYLWVKKIKLDLGEIGLGVMDWIGLTQGRDQWGAHVNIQSRTFCLIACFLKT
jgi:hypothetical protein